MPLAVVAGLSQAEQLEPVTARARIYIWRAAGVSAALVLVLAFLWRLSWKLARTKSQAHRALLLHDDLRQLVSRHQRVSYFAESRQRRLLILQPGLLPERLVLLVLTEQRTAGKDRPGEAGAATWALGPA